MIVVLILALSIVSFLGAKDGWRLFGTQLCTDPEKIAIQGYHIQGDQVLMRGLIADSSASFVGYTSYQVGSKLYIGLKYNYLLGFFKRNGRFDIQLSVNLDNPVEEVYLVGSGKSRLIQYDAQKHQALDNQSLDFILARLLDPLFLYKSCIEENYGLQVDFTFPYRAYYQDEASYKNDWYKPQKLIKALSAEDTTGLYKDPAETDFYPVTEFKSLQALKASYEAYFASEVVDGLIPKYAFIEYEKKLYRVRGDRGYGMVTLDTKTMEILEVSPSRCQLGIMVTVDGTQDHQALLEYHFIDNRWRIVKIERTGAQY